MHNFLFLKEGPDRTGVKWEIIEIQLMLSTHLGKMGLVTPGLTRSLAT